MTLSLENIRNYLIQDNLLKEFVNQKNWFLNLPEHLAMKKVTHLSYDSRDITSDTLFFCKGLTFKEDYLQQAVAQGLTIYVAEQPYETVDALGIIVTDIKKAMALLSMAFYDYPQKKLHLIGFTGTKGKTTAAYFTKTILAHTTQQKVAMLSTMNSTLDGETFFKSQLTTPESLDLYRMMAEAVTKGMTHFVMEVSSQAYKTQRVYGLFFDVGIFLNISPDHISPIEHPTFDDYFYCKRQLIQHAKTFVLNRDTDYFELLAETAQTTKTRLITYGHAQGEQADYCYEPSTTSSLDFQITAADDFLNIAGAYSLRLGGDFNKGNALSAAITSALVGANRSDCQRGIEETTVPGRMEHLTHVNGAQVYVDYAHNYDSLKNLLTFIRSAHPQGRLIVVIGSTGNKAVSRRADFGKVLSELADVAVLTTDDPADEDPVRICEQIAAAIDRPMEIKTIIDRKQAIQEALSISQPDDAVVLAGKGADLYQKIHGKDVFYEGDFSIAQHFIENSK